MQGDIIQIVDANGAVVVEYTYDVWGKVLNVTGSMAGTLGEIQPFRYRGYVYDVETGLYYLRSRYYRPTESRFLNLDCLMNSNLFAYCLNNPVIRFDKNGFLFEELVEYLRPTCISNEAALDETLHYTYAEIAINANTINGTRLRYREKPYCTEDNYTICDKKDISSIYVYKKEVVEGVNLPDEAIDRDPDRIWFSAIIFWNEPASRPHECWISADYLYLILGDHWVGDQNNENWTNLRSEPSIKSTPKGQLDKYTPVTVIKEDMEQGWSYVSSPIGCGWVKNRYINTY